LCVLYLSYILRNRVTNISRTLPSMFGTSRLNMVSVVDMWYASYEALNVTFEALRTDP
jgi:hypothetical protein